ncbi:TolB family protein [Pseudorhodoferax sp.]|uniref:TolB family protein n=1 Tax=Pseudorhodoferax sp. TaxID=1993553 RepID=UPI002DD69629|nr:hypothetical protein [Pseudorhodoferax sp.]
MRTLLLAGLALACLTACGGGGGGTLPPPDPIVAHDLVFDNEAGDGSRRLQRVSPEGGVAQPVPNAVHAVRPHARADGAALLFTSFSTDPLQVPALMLLDDLARPAVVLSDTAGIYEREAVFAPDGRRIVFVSEREEPGGSDIFVATLNGRRLENIRNLTPGTMPGRPMPVLNVTPAWSPDGGRIAFASNRSGGDFTLWVMDADGRNPRELTPAGQQADVFPSWSPDGRTLAFQRRSPSAVRVGLIPAAGGNPAFFEFNGSAYAPAWSPDGSRIAFGGLVEGEYDIHVRAASGIGPVTRIRNPGADRNPAWLARAG